MNLSPYNKAIAGAAATLLVMILTKMNIIITDELHDAIEILIGVVIVGASIFFAKKNTDGR
jgi:hypothetical protein